MSFGTSTARVSTSAVLTLAAALAACPASAGQSQARRILEATGVTGGLIVHLGCGDGTLTAALRANDRCVVHGLDADVGNVAEARENIREAGLSGVVWVDRLGGERLPYAESMVNLLVSGDLGAVTMGEVMRVLVPHGVAYVKKGGTWAKTVKPWPADIDEWTHWLHGPDGNAVASDMVAGPPRLLRWIARPLWSRHHNTVPSVSAIVSAKGRLFYIVDEAPASMDGSAPDKWSLVARDAFNGLELWRIPLPDWGWKAWSAAYTCRFTVPTHVPRRLVAVADRVYVTLGFNAPLSEVDAATGKVLRTFDGTAHTDEILCDKDLLIVSINRNLQRPGPAAKRRGEGAAASPVPKWVAAIETDTGRMRWKRGDYVGLRSKTGSMDRISHLSMAAGGGKVFFLDRDALVSLSLKDGGETWRTPRPRVPELKIRYNIRITDMCSLVYHDGTVFLAQLSPDRKIDWREIQGRLHAFSADTGKELWSHPCASWGWGHPPDVFIIDGLVWVHGYESRPRTPSQCRPRSARDLGAKAVRVRSEGAFVLGLDPATGKVRRKVSNLEAFDNGHHHRCYRNKATQRFLMTSFRGLEFIPLDGGPTQFHHWVRGTCRLGAIPCNGMIYATPHPCDCYITSKLNGFVALAPARRDEGRGASDEGAEPRLERGPAFGEIGNRQSAIGTANDWPMYRHDPERSGSTTCAVRGPLRTVWQIELGARPTSPVIADGRMFVACQSTREVHALSAENGERLWRFTAGGRVDTPPTVCKGRVLFGCTNGWVYCLRASDGALGWRFRAAPEDRLVGAFGGLESAWPVHGSVLVKDDAVYFTAGRSSFLDGGIHAYSLDVETGGTRSHKQIQSSYAAAVDTGRNQSADTGRLSDLLVGHAGAVYMRQRRLFGEAAPAKDGRQLRSTAGLLDDSWFSRTRWFLDGVQYAEYLVFDATSVYGVRARSSMSANGGLFRPGAKGYQLFAADRAPAQQDEPATRDNKKRRRAKRRSRDRWCIAVPLRVGAMVLAGDTLIAAGAPDAIDPEDAWAAYEGRRGGKLLVLSASDGGTKAEHKLGSPPVLDGLAVAAGRLFVSQTNGRVVCMTGQQR